MQPAPGHSIDIIVLDTPLVPREGGKRSSFITGTRISARPLDARYARYVPASVDPSYSCSYKYSPVNSLLRSNS
eukprot:scaffold5173_cov97-Skeletonema_menzelii.AAC.1